MDSGAGRRRGPDHAGGLPVSTDAADETFIFGNVERPRRRTKHRVGDIHYEPDDGPSWLVCDTDGTRLDAASPAKLADLWTAHGGTAQKAHAEQFPAAAPKARDMCPERGCEMKHPRHGLGGCRVHVWHKAKVA